MREERPDNASSEFGHHRALDEIEERRKRVDKYLQYGIETLLCVARKVKKDSPGTTIPPSISETAAEAPEHYPLCHALVAATLKKVWRQRRRFLYLRDVEPELIEWLPTPFTTLPSLSDPRKLEFLTTLDSRAFGALNPLTTSHVLRALLEEGESATIAPRGMLALFSVLWALGRRHGEWGAAGAAIEPWRPTAGVTAKCIFAITALKRACVHRANLFANIGAALRTLMKHSSAERVLDRWTFCHTGDQLTNDLYDLAQVSTNATVIEASAGAIRSQVNDLTSTASRDQNKNVFDAIEISLRDALGSWHENLKSCIDSARPVLSDLLPDLTAQLTDNGYKELQKYGLKFSSDPDTDYWNDQQRAARDALDICNGVADALELRNETLQDLSTFITAAEAAYRKIGASLEASLAPCIRWCQIVVRDQIAHASAGNQTDFDAAELVSATAVCGLRPNFSQLETLDAIQKSRAGSRADGSWARGQPIYLLERALGAWPSTPDIIWMLCTALDNYPDITDLDDVLMRFVEWAERTLNVVRPRNWSPEFAPDGLKGWSAELYRDERTIDVWTTAVTVNALLEIRDILEHRALQLCEKRFSVERRLKGLDEVLPVDLGAAHGQRLHRRLRKTILETRVAKQNAEYSFVFHGPPGSSKTILANALGREMWQPRDDGDVKLIRITPADFTRQGSDRLDAEARFIFKLLSHTRRVTVLFDEIDDLLRERITPGDATFFKLVVPAMLNRLQDLRDVAPQQEICFILGTNFIDRIDPALIRRGRVDATIAVPYPDAFSRVAIFEKAFDGNIPDDDDCYKLIEACEGLPYAVVKGVAERAKQGNRALLAEERANDVKQHYQDKSRWKRTTPLLDEWLHAVAARRSDPNENKQAIDDLKGFAKAPQLSRLHDDFERLCTDEGRFMTGTFAKLRKPAP